MSLPSAWIDRIFTRILVRYGAAWNAMWRGIPEDAVKADWAQQLHGLTDWALRHGLDNLPPDRPPTAMQFRAICAMARSDAPALPAPAVMPANPQRLADLRARLATVGRSGPGPREWIDRLLERQRNGERLNHGQLDALERASRADALAFSDVAAEFNPPPADALPPAMREEMSR